jgi:transcriptional regulator with XRE-family HTH domain
VNVLGNRVRAARERLGLSQPELAERLGWQRTEVVSVETGQHANPTAKRLRLLAQTLQVTADHLLGLDAPAPKPRPRPRKAPGK